MTNLQKLRVRASEIRSKLNELSGVEDLSDEQRSEMDALSKEYQDVERRSRAAIIAEGEDDEGRTTPAEPDAEMRERVELRGKASLTNYLLAAARGRLPDGAEAELAEAAGVEGIPLELWDVPAEAEERAITPAPGTVGVNLDPIRPAVFAPSIAPRLGVEMPRVASGTFASGTITTSVTAGPRAKSANAPQTEGAITVTTATPKRVAASVAFAIEDIKAVGQANFESILRENMSMALSAELDNQVLNGDGQNNALTGLFQRLADPAAPGATVTDFDDFVSAFAGGVDGLWASRMNEVAIVVGVDTYRVAAQAFRDATGQDLGDISFADYAMDKFGGFWTNSRMPAAAANVQQAVLYRTGRSGMRTAVCPHWGEIGIDDIYSGSLKGERQYTMHVLLGDVIVVQSAAYAQVNFRTAV
ncbi:MAG: phage major capsid protein [Gammaproteobacteria bacterium]|nr:phage major capsid protein [Gammaproteobacteria bacterium]